MLCQVPSYQANISIGKSNIPKQKQTHNRFLSATLKVSTHDKNISNVPCIFTEKQKHSIVNDPQQRKQDRVDLITNYIREET